MLPRLQQAIEVLPAEALERGVFAMTVAPVSWNEPPLLDERFSAGIPLPEAVAAMQEFNGDDCACELELAWLLWRYAGGSWEQVPHPVRFLVNGRDFGDAAAREEGDLIVDFGLDEVFLAELAPWDEETRKHLQANILQLLAFSHKLQAQLHPLRRRLWSDTEEDWTRKLVLRVDAADTAIRHEV